MAGHGDRTLSGEGDAEMRGDTSGISRAELIAWCRIPYTELECHPERKIPFRLCRDSEEMGALMARELVDEIRAVNAAGAACAIGRDATTNFCACSDNRVAVEHSTTGRPGCPTSAPSPPVELTTNLVA